MINTGARPQRLRQRRFYQLLHQPYPTTSSWIHPLFIHEALAEPMAIPALPGHYQWPIGQALCEAIQNWCEVGVTQFLIFAEPNCKDRLGSMAVSAEAPLVKAITYLHQHLPNAVLWADLCLCTYTADGHCGVWDHRRHTIDTEASLALLEQQALLLAHAGVDGLAPSGMIDGTVAHLRQALDQQGFCHCPIMSYSCKYASHLYGPFRQAVHSAPTHGDRSTYQMDPTRRNEALLEAELDIQQGADMLMVKPAGLYLDVVHQIKQTFPHMPLAVYHVSGEYASLILATSHHLLEWPHIAFETLNCCQRAGADVFIHYFLPKLLPYLRQTGC